MFKDKTLLISGGTGSFGNAVLHHFISTDLKEIRIFSRDEKKQDDMRKRYNNDKIKFYIGDVRDYQSVRSLRGGVDTFFMQPHLNKCLLVSFSRWKLLRPVIGTNNVLTQRLMLE